MSTFILAISCLTTSNLPLIHGPNIPGSCAILLFIASDLASITSPIHNGVLCLLWLHPFILSGVISPLVSSSILGTYWPGEFIFQCPIFLPFHTVHGFSRQEYWSGLPFPSPVNHILSDLSIMTHPSWVALHGTPHSFIELDKAVVHVISLVSFLWLWFRFVCPLMDKDKRVKDFTKYEPILDLGGLKNSFYNFKITKVIYEYLWSNFFKEQCRRI